MPEGFHLLNTTDSGAGKGVQLFICEDKVMAKSKLDEYLEINHEQIIEMLAAMGEMMILIKKLDENIRELEGRINKEIGNK